MLGFHGSNWPEAGSNEARLVRGCPSMAVKYPPTYRIPSPSASALTLPFRIGFHVATDPSDRMCARPLRGWPPTSLKEPPMYQPPFPSEITAPTLPPTLGNTAGTDPFVASTGTPPPLGGPTAVNPPAM